MENVLPEFLDIQYRHTKKMTRLALILAMVFPVYFYGPLIWKDGSYAGRWEFASDVGQRPVECRGLPYLFQACEVKYVERTSKRLVTLDYLVVGVNWKATITDIVRSDDGHVTSAVGVTKPGVFARVGALLCLLVIGLAIESFVRRSKFHALQRKAAALTAGPRNRSSVSLSRDRRDHLR